MTSSVVNPVKGFFSAVAGDAFLFAAALFGIAMTVAGGIMSLGELIGPDGPVGPLGQAASAMGGLLSLASVVAGAVIAWKLHGRGFGATTPAAIVLGIVAGAIAGAIGFFVLAGMGMGVSALTGSEFGGPIAMAVVAVVVSLIIVVRLDYDAVRDMAPTRNEHRRLDVVRLVATGVLAVYSIGVVVAVYMNPGSEVGEAILFAILAGTQAGLVTAFADWWVRRAEHKSVETGAALGV